MKDTFMAKAGSVEQKWYVVDAEGKIVGRLAAEIAKVLRGKNKPEYTKSRFHRQKTSQKSLLSSYRLSRRRKIRNCRRMDAKISRTCN